jgi:allantoate deiminase
MRLPSGAGHDAMAMAAITDVAMLFVRCKAGISHNPAESISPADALTAAQTLRQFIREFRLHRHAAP